MTSQRMNMRILQQRTLGRKLCHLIRLFQGSLRRKPGSSLSGMKLGSGAIGWRMRHGKQILADHILATNNIPIGRIVQNKQKIIICGCI